MHLGCATVVCLMKRRQRSVGQVNHDQRTSAMHVYHNGQRRVTRCAFAVSGPMFDRWAKHCVQLSDPSESRSDDPVATHATHPSRSKQA